MRILFKILSLLCEIIYQSFSYSVVQIYGKMQGFFQSGFISLLNSTVNSLETTPTLHFMFSLLATSRSTTVTAVAAAGISLSMALNAEPRGLLKVHSTC